MPTYLTLASQIAITALFAISVDLILGYAGIITLGHAMFFGLGAYTAGLLSKAGWGEPLTGLLLAGGFAGCVGFVVSFIIVRVQHLALIMITLGLGFLSYELANAMRWLTGGTDGLQGVDIWPIFGVFGFDLWGYTAYSYALIVLFIGLLLSRRMVHSSFGLSLRGIRENLRRMPAIGSELPPPPPDDLHDLGGDGRRRRRTAHADDRDGVARDAELPALCRCGRHADPRAAPAASMARSSARSFSCWRAISCRT